VLLDEALAATAGREVSSFMVIEEIYGRHWEREACVMALYEFTSQMATLDPPPPRMQQLLRATRAHQAFTDSFDASTSSSVSTMTSS
jgi:uncharacterized protein (DUF1778 family)